MRNTTSVVLPSDQLEYVRRIAEAEDRSVSSVIRQLVTAHKERDTANGAVTTNGRARSSESGVSVGAYGEKA